MQYKDIITLDIETFSKTDLIKCGLYRYANDPSFEILLCAYHYASVGIVQQIDLTTGKNLSDQLVKDLQDPTILKRAHNAQFERVCIGVHLSVWLDPAQWQCTAVKCASLGLPRKLENAAFALNLEIKKDTRGKKYINLFTKPRKIPKPPKRKIVDADYFRDRNFSRHYPEDWEGFKEYNRIDVKVEVAIDDALSFFDVPQKEHELWQLDQRINDRGVKVNRRMVNAAVEMHEDYKEKLFKECLEITGIESTNKLSQIKTWLSNELEEEITKLDKDVLPVLINSVEDPRVRRVLEIRQETNKSSIDKYKAMQRTMNSDDYVRGLLAFYAADTGRWASKLVQLQNLLRNDDGFDLARARRLIIDRNIDLIELLWGSPSYVFSQCVRTALIPETDHKLIASDFKQIESRVLAWVANEQWKIKAFADGIDIYTVGGSKMFRKPIEEIKGDWRQKAKIGELACGYQGSVGAVARMWPKYLPMPSLSERQAIVNSYRDANPNIYKTWYEVQEAALDAVREPGKIFEAAKCAYFVKKDYLFCELPSGRPIVYYKPQIVDGMYGDALECYTIGKNYQYKRNSLYGGLLTENLVQGIARDLLGEKMVQIDKAGFQIVFHVHDEDVNQVHKNKADWAAKEINRIMSEPISWAKGLPLAAKTDILDFYKKD